MTAAYTLPPMGQQEAQTMGETHCPYFWDTAISTNMFFQGNLTQSNLIPFPLQKPPDSTP